MSKTKQKGDMIAIVIMIVVAVILIPILVINLTLIIKGSINKDVPPDIGGIAPLAVTSGSMSGDKEDSFDKGELIFVKILGDEEKQSLQVGDVVCYRTEDVFVTHRIIRLNTDENGALVSVVTQGDANNFDDGEILVADIFGRNVGSVAGLGSFTMFLQTPAGIVVCLGVPIVLFILYDVIRITLYNRKVKAEGAEDDRDKDEELRDKDEEIRRLRALVEQQSASAPSAGEIPAAEPTAENKPSSTEIPAAPLAEEAALSDPTVGNKSDAIVAESSAGESPSSEPFAEK